MQPVQSDIASHIPVLKDEVLAALSLQQDSLVVDATFGRGGHARSIMAELGDRGRLIVIDRDPAAIARAQREWSEDGRVDIVHAPFSMLSEILRQRNLFGHITAILFDFGVSSPQLDDAERGFSFSHDGPLDMRMDTTRGISAKEWLQQVEEHELIHVLRKFGEERFARKVAARIKQHDQIETTGELAAIVSEVVKTREPGKHPATRTFQAIRIAVNAELEEIESVLPQALECLATGGRLVIISFHSLEDRLVKRFFRDQSKGDPFPPDLPVTSDMLSPTMRLVGKPIKAGADELDLNRRARSAVLRVAEKTD
ncbi:MAG: 16S rRNA (cytosine(1402)-N(4))-methyltransferase RsmH [Acidiferrobacterales bacterium]|nr:16S rRNA (cytosine(1402)-N(4))-methyltransferase RsmH [Acidiferrobacterales bacterium]